MSAAVDAGEVIAQTEEPTSDFRWLDLDGFTHAVAGQAIHEAFEAGHLPELRDYLADRFVQVLTFATAGPDLAPWPHIHEQTLRECGWRPVHRQSARKHRRQGHAVKWVPETGGYWWRAQA